jgi:Glyoxalase-like domain
MVFWQLTVDAVNPGQLARFWAQALGYQSAPPGEPDTTWNSHYRARLGGGAAFHDRLFNPAGQRAPIWFQRVPETKAGKNRLHLDLYPTGRDNALPLERRVEMVEAKVAELLGLGASIERRTRHDDPEDPRYFVVMHDPEGNEFCVGG